MTYVLSQILITLSYVFLLFSYICKKRNFILINNIVSLVFLASGYIFLSAWTGLAMTSVAMVRSTLFLFEEFYFEKHKRSKIIDYLTLFALISLITICAYFTFDDFYSLFSVIATLIYTYSLWQKNNFVYIILGPIVSLLWILYNIYIFSVSGIILESVLLIGVSVKLVYEIIRYFKNKKTKNLELNQEDDSLLKNN